ncbi:MAG: hypothetical protein HY368_00735 [Candidatus Aenigmarchaeota archaeon]|nr:hypothetical protein [Candidatus Aenigmarchaeota archaeon]
MSAEIRAQEIRGQSPVRRAAGNFYRWSSDIVGYVIPGSPAPLPEAYRGKIDLLQQTSRLAENLQKLVYRAGIESSQKCGRLEHEIAYGLMMPTADIWGELGHTVRWLEGPTKKMSRTMVKKTDNLRRALAEGIPENELTELHTKLLDALALEGQLRGGVLYFAEVLQNRRGQSVTDEDLAAMEPISRIEEAIKSYRKFQKAFEANIPYKSRLQLNV